MRWIQVEFSPWDGILAEMVVGDSFGADRIDYLLRDSVHTGVAYGRFDHHRLISTLRILPAVPSPGADGTGAVPELGIERGGLEAAEGLLLARYFMFGQVYFHPTRLIYDQHLKDFLKAWLGESRFPTDVAGHLALTDAEISVELRKAARDTAAPGHDAARRIIDRDHFRVVYQRRPGDTTFEVRALFDAACEEFGAANIRYAGGPKRGGADFPVRNRDGSSVSALSLSPVLDQLPVSHNQYVFAAPEIRKDAKAWLDSERQDIIDRAVARETEDNGDGNA